MARVKIPYYSVRRNGRGFWEPRPHMRSLGFCSVPCGSDGPDAWTIAEEWNRRWLAVRRGDAPSPAMASVDNLSPERSEELTIYPPHSLGEASGDTGALKSGRVRHRARERLVAVLAMDKADIR